MDDAYSFDERVKGATVFQWNARGLRARLSDFRQFTFQHQFPILAISESRVEPDFRLSGYEVFQSARPSNVSRVLLALRKNLTYVSHNVTSHPDNEYVSVTVRKGKLTFTVIAAYIAPACNFDPTRLDDIIRQCKSPVLVVGDFNAHNIAWGSVRTTRRGRELLELADSHDLCLLNDGSPTFIRANRCSSCLDVAFMSRELVTRNSWFVDVESHGSDHIPTYITVRGFHVDRASHNRTSCMDWTCFRDSVEQRIHNTTTYEEFVSVMHQSATEATRTVNLSASRTVVDAEYEKLRAIRRRAERRARRTKLKADIREDRRTQKHIRRHLDKLGRKKWRRTCASFDPRAPLSKIWHIARGLRFPPQQRTPFLALSLFLRRSSLDIAEEFCASLILSAASDSEPPDIADQAPVTSSSHFMDDIFSAPELDQALASLNHSSSPGPDKITYGTLAHLGLEARQHLLEIFNASWTGGNIPPDWKAACVVPILKPGKSPLDLKSYRPIALTSCVGKCMERLVLSRIEWLLETKSIYPATMTGFRQGRSSIDNVVDLVTHVDDQKLRGKITIAVFLDVRGAFDNIKHSAVLRGLKTIGIGGRCYAWIADYLHNRTIYMRTNEGDTSRHTVIKGVPQGGVLSPVLFNIALIGITEILTSSVHITLYADDICLWTSAGSLKLIHARLQDALSKISQFLNIRGLEIAPAKSAAVAFTRMKMTRYPLSINGNQIPYVPNHVFLGVSIDKGLTWNSQLKHLKKKLSAFTSLGRFISGTTWGTSTSALLRLYSSLFVGVLRYSLPVMHGLSPTNMKALQSLQAQALRVCLGVPQSTATIDTIAESHCLPIKAIRTQETLRIHMRHLTRHQSHHLADIPDRCFYSRISQTIIENKEALPTAFQEPVVLGTPPWSLPPLEIYKTIPGITKKSTHSSVVLQQLSLSLLYTRHWSSCHIYTDASTTHNGSSIGLAAPALHLKAGYKLSHKTSSTAAELVAIREGLRYIREAPPRTWTIISDSLSALQSLQCLRKNSPNRQVILDILKVHSDIFSLGHSVSFQWVPSHCGVSGNEMADSMAAQAHESLQQVVTPFTKSDICTRVAILAKSTATSLWKEDINQSSSLKNIDPHLLFRVPPGLKRRHEAVLHRIRLKVAYTNRYLHLIGKLQSPNCTQCGTFEDIKHILLQCTSYHDQRKQFLEDIRQPPGSSLTMQIFLGPWDSEACALNTTKALLRFLSATGLDKRL